MKKKLIAMMLLAGGSAFAATQFSIGVGIGGPAYYPPAPPPPPAYYGGYDAQPPAPGPGYVWIDGYYGPDGYFVPGYWALPPYPDAYWIAPTFVGGVFHAGYWGHRDFDHDRNRFFDHDRDRDFDHDRFAPGRFANGFRSGDEFHGRGTENRFRGNSGFAPGHDKLPGGHGGSHGNGDFRR